MNLKTKILCLAILWSISLAFLPIGKAQQLNAGSSSLGQCITPNMVNGLQGGNCSDATLGAYYTPKGRLHVLVIVLYKQGVLSNSAWDNSNNELPGLFKNTSNIPGPGIQTPVFNEDPSTVSGYQPYRNLSEYFYTFSNPSNRFIVTGYVYPYKVPVSALPADLSLCGASNQEAIDWIAANDSNFDWSKFDLRAQATTQFDTDNSAPATDNKIDYVVFMNSLNVGQGYGSTGLYDYVIPNTQYKIHLGHSFSVTPIQFAQFGKDFLHEYAHVNMAAPHYSGANNTHGTTYNVQNFYGMMGGGGMGFFTPTAWESWFNGWLTPANFVEVHPQTLGGGIFELKDFATHHAAMRIEIPNSSIGNKPPQYLWLENRKKINYWDDKQLYNWPGINDVMGTGVYAYVVKNEGSSLSSPCIDNIVGANLIKPISADGSFDWEYYGIGNGLFGPVDVARKLEENGLSGGTYRATYPTDFDTNQVLHLGQWAGNMNFGNSQGDLEIVYHEAEQVGNVMEEHWKHAGNDDEAFQIGGEIGLSGAMPAVNYPNYNDGTYYNSGPAQTTEPIYLNGLSVKYIGNNSAGDARIQVRYDDYEVRAHKRWCGNIILPDFNPNITTEHLNIATGVEVRIDQSKTPHRETINPITGTWVNPTKFDVLSGGAMHLDHLANVIVENNSEMILESGASLEVHDGAVVRVRTNGTLRLKGGSKAYVHDGGRIVIERGAKIVYENGADITLNGFNSVLEIHGNLEIGAGANFTFHGNGVNSNAGFIRFDLPTVGNFAPNITCGIGSKITLSGAGTTDLVMEVWDNTTVHPDGNLDNITVQNGLVKMGKIASLNTGNADIRLYKLLVTSFQPTVRHGGIYVNGQANHVIDQVEISYGNRGITANQFYNDGAILKIANSSFHDCDQALVVYKKGAILTACHMNHNNYGYIHYYPSFNSRAQGSSFNDNAVRGVHVSAAGGNLLFDHSSANTNGKQGIYFTGNGSLALTCASASYNSQVGIYGGHGSYLALDNSANPLGAQSTVYKNPVSISLNLTKELYLNRGRNEITSLVHSTKNDIRGTMMKTCPTNTSLSIAASRNHWNFRLAPCANAPASNQSDYSVVGSNGCPINFQDQTPVCAPQVCDVAPGGGGAGEPGIASPLESCPACQQIHTARFPNETLHKAVQTAIANMGSVNAAMNDLDALAMFHEIITYNYAALSVDEQWLVDLAYTKLWATFASACESGKINIQESANTPLPDDHAAKVLAAIASMRARAAMAPQQQSLDLDRATAYTYLNRNGTALLLLDALMPELEVELRDYATVMQCQLKAEENVKKGKLPVWEYESAIASCNPAMKFGEFAQAIMDPQSPLRPMSAKVYPNPSNGRFALTVKAAAPGDGVARLYDVFGKEVGSQRLLIEPGQMESKMEFDATHLPAGFYMYRFTDGAGSVATGELVVVK
jgi:Right handed beta helix region/Secretion system C-terminal sorting domain